MIHINNRTLDEYMNVIVELEAITNQPGNLTHKQEARHATLLAKAKALNLSASVEEIRHWEKDRLLKIAGLPRAPERGQLGRLDEETEHEWRAFGLGEPVRATRVPPDSETRAYATPNEGGQQSLTSTQLAAGGGFVPVGCHERTFETAKQYDQIFDSQFCNVIETPTGASTSFPVWDDITQNSFQVGETAKVNEADVINFGSSMLNAWKQGSGIVAVSLELLQDSNWPFGTVLERVFAMRFARGIGAKLISGNGLNTLTGLLTGVVGAGAQIVVANGSGANTGGAETGSTSIGSQDINTAFHKLNPAYRSGAVWAMNDNTLAYLQGLIDKVGASLVKLVGELGAPTIHGRNVCICPSMPDMAAGANPVVLYNPAYFVQRRVPSSMYVQRFDQSPSLVEAGLCGFQEFCRVDSAFIAPTPGAAVAAVILQNHS